MLSAVFAMDPIECKVSPQVELGFTVCGFKGIKESEMDVTCIKPLTELFQGKETKKNEVTAILFIEFELVVIPSAIFDAKLFGEITKLKLVKGTLKTINQKSLEKATKLKSLEIYGTQIHEISSNAFELAGDLEEIVIQDCKIDYIALDAFVRLKKLKKVQMIGSKYSDNNFLDNIPNSVEKILTKPIQIEKSSSG